MDLTIVGWEHYRGGGCAFRENDAPSGAVATEGWEFLGFLPLTCTLPNARQVECNKAVIKKFDYAPIVIGSSWT